MKLRNKKTGEIVDLSEGIIRDTYGGEKIQIKPIAISNKEGYVYNSLAELNEEWEDYEEPKGWCITMYGGISRINKYDENFITDLKEIGNYFNDKESAYDALEKLQAWKRLKDKGFRLNSVVGNTFFCLDVFTSGESYEAIKDDLKIVFGGEE